MNKIYKFMDGRYGIDELYKFLLIICTILILLNTIEYIYLFSEALRIAKYVWPHPKYAIK